MAYLGNCASQQVMRIGLPRAILSNFDIKKCFAVFDIFIDTDKYILLRIKGEIMNTVTGVSLFTGAGGMDVGFEKAGVQVLMANEIMKEASDTYNANHKPGIMINADINNIMEEISKFKGVNVVFGGPPCQGFSVAGKMDPNDNRSKMIFTFLDVVDLIRPEVFVMENVKALGALEKWSNVRKKYLEKVRTIGYKCFYLILNATEYDVPQKEKEPYL